MPTYEELLNDPNWNRKRKEILLRDKYECTECQNTKILHDAHITAIGGCTVHEDYTNLSLYNYEEINKEEKATGDPFRPLLAWFNSRLIAKWNHANFQNLNIPSDSLRYLETHPKEFFNRDNVNILYFKTGSEPFVKVAAFCNKMNALVILAYRQNIADLLPQNKEQVLQEQFTSLKELENGFKWYYVSGMHVHHSYYQEGVLPWEYPTESLKTFCWICHENFHKNKKVPYYSKNGEKSELTPCWKCHGAGEFPQWQHVEEGICFACSGARYEELIGGTPF